MEPWRWVDGSVERSWEETGERRHHQNIFNEFSIKKKDKKGASLDKAQLGLCEPRAQLESVPVPRVS